MKYIVIQKSRIPVNDEVYTKIKNQERYEERLIERLSDNEILIGDEKELDTLRVYEEQMPYTILERRETYLMVMKIINTRLTAKERYILTSVYLDNKRQYEVANELDLTIDQVRYLLKTIIKKIRKIYDIMD